MSTTAPHTFSWKAGMHPTSVCLSEFRRSFYDCLNQNLSNVAQTSKKTIKPVHISKRNIQSIWKCKDRSKGHSRQRKCIWNKHYWQLSSCIRVLWWLFDCHGLKKKLKNWAWRRPRNGKEPADSLWALGGNHSKSLLHCTVMQDSGSWGRGSISSWYATVHLIRTNVPVSLMTVVINDVGIYHFVK